MKTARYYDGEISEYQLAKVADQVAPDSPPR
jgi:hypothetical protein